LKEGQAGGASRQPKNQGPLLGIVHSAHNKTKY